MPFTLANFIETGMKSSSPTEERVEMMNGIRDMEFGHGNPIEGEVGIDGRLPPYTEEEEAYAWVSGFDEAWYPYTVLPYHSKIRGVSYWKINPASFENFHLIESVKQARSIDSENNEVNRLLLVSKREGKYAEVSKVWLLGLLNEISSITLPNFFTDEEYEEDMSSPHPHFQNVGEREYLRNYPRQTRKAYSVEDCYIKYVTQQNRSLSSQAWRYLFIYRGDEMPKIHSFNHYEGFTP